MSTLVTPRRPRRAQREKPRPQAEQVSLFAAAPAAPPRRAPAPTAAPAPAPTAAPAPAPTAAPATAPSAAPAPAPGVPTSEPGAAVAPEPATTASARRHGPTLDDLVAGAWEGLLAGAPASCLVCGTPMHPRHSAGHGAVGGRCTGCGTTLG